MRETDNEKRNKLNNIQADELVCVRKYKMSQTKSFQPAVHVCVRPCER